MAASSATGASSPPLAAFASPRRLPDAASASIASTPTVSSRTAAARAQLTPGLLVGRPDLSEEAVLGAIAERMAFEGRDASKAQAVLNAALAGRPVAAAFCAAWCFRCRTRRCRCRSSRSCGSRPPARDERGSWFSRLSFGR